MSAKLSSEVGNLTVARENSNTTEGMSDILVSLVLVSGTVVCFVFSGLSLVALNRTRNIPKTARTLSSCLLALDCSTVATFAFRRLISDTLLTHIVTMIAIGWSSASFMMIALMSIDRLILFQFPYFYTRKFTNGIYTGVYFVVVALYLSLYSTQWVYCTVLGSVSISECSGIASNISATKMVSACVSIICFTWILVIIVKQKNEQRPRSESKSTVVVFLCCINYAVTGVISTVISASLQELTLNIRRVIVDVLYIFNGFADTCFYVLWFNECRYELLKIIATICPTLKGRVERMRADVTDNFMANPPPNVTQVAKQ